MLLDIKIPDDRIIAGPGLSVPPENVAFKRDTSSEVTIRFWKDGVQTELAAGATGKFGIKLRGEYDAAALVYAESWTKVGTGAATTYVFDPSLNGEALAEALGADGETGNDLDFVECMLEVLWIESEKKHRTQTQPCTVANDVLKELDGTPLALPNPEDWLDARAVRFDEREQDLTEEQKQRVRLKLNAQPSPIVGFDNPNTAEIPGEVFGNQYLQTTPVTFYPATRWVFGEESWIRLETFDASGNVTFPSNLSVEADFLAGNASIASLLVAGKQALVVSRAATASISASGNTTLTVASGEPNVVATVTVGAGSGAYSANLILSATGAHAGAFVTIHVDLPSSLNPRIQVRNLTSGGTILDDAIGTGTARRVSIRAVYDGANWSIVSRVPSAETFEFLIASAPSGTTGSAGAWVFTPPVGYRQAIMDCLSGGGGGASGRRGAAGSVRFGGGGGGGGSRTIIRTTRANLEAISSGSWSITVGAGGAGGAATGTDSTDGNAGGSGGGSRVRLNLTDVCSALINQGGGSIGPQGGAAGSAASGLGGSSLISTTNCMHPGAPGTQANAGAASGSNSVNVMAGAGGIGGGSISSGNALSGVGSVFGGAGAGGVSAVGSAASAGGNATGFGHGGGGGGASENGFASGAGGNGSPGRVLLTFIY